MNRPITIDGTPAITLVKKRSTRANTLRLPYSLRYTAPAMPSGTAIAVAVAVMTSVPTIAAFMPGPGRRGDSWMSSVNHFGNCAGHDRPALADDRRRARGRARPDDHEGRRGPSGSSSPVFLTRRRPLTPARLSSSSADGHRCRRRRVLHRGGHDVPCIRRIARLTIAVASEVDDEREHEQRQTHGDQRAALLVAGRLAPLEGDDRRAASRRTRTRWR